MRRAAFVVCVLIASCARYPNVEHGLIVMAPKEHIGADVLVNGRAAGRIRSLDTYASFWQAVIHKIQGLPPLDDVGVVEIDLSRVALAPGEQQLRVEKAGLTPAAGSFRYPFAGAQVQTLVVCGSEIRTVDNAKDEQTSHRQYTSRGSR